MSFKRVTYTWFFVATIVGAMLLAAPVATIAGAAGVDLTMEGGGTNVSDMDTSALPQQGLAAFREFIFPTPRETSKETPNMSGDLDTRLGDKTEVVLVVHKGKIIFEEYRSGYHKDMPHQLWSIGKSVTNAFIGIAVQEGKLSLNDSICEYLETQGEVANTSWHCDITVRNLLHWSSSLKWQEWLGLFKLKRSSMFAMFYGEGRSDTARFVFNHGMEGPAGKHFTYSTGDTVLLWAILRRAYGEAEYETLPWTKLFDRIGLTDVTIERDPTGLYFGGSHIFMKPRDLARYAQFFLNDGVLPGGESLLPPNWRNFSTALAPSMIGHNGSHTHDMGAGAHWWLNIAISKSNVELPWPDAPADTFAAMGVFGQTLIIIPSRDLIIIRLANDWSREFDRNRLVKLALALLK